MVMMNRGMYSSNKLDTKTSNWLVDELSQVFHWNLDVCSSEPNVCSNYFDEQDNGLSQDWVGLCWMNPPYGKQISKWIEKAKESDCTTVCLIPARTDTKWWQDNIPHASLVVFIRGRLKFENTLTYAPFPSAFVVFGNLTEAQNTRLRSYGWSISEWL